MKTDAENCEKRKPKAKFTNRLRVATRRWTTTFYLQLDKIHTRVLPATQQDDTMFRQKGELFQNQSQMVTWLPTYFHQLHGQVRMATAFAGDPATELLGPYDVQVESAAHVICHLARNMTPQEACVFIGNRIYKENKHFECLAVLDFLRITTTRASLGNLSGLAIVPPTAPVADLNLLRASLTKISYSLNPQRY